MGDFLEITGYGGKRCCHLDFGYRLRKIGGGLGRPMGLTDSDVAFVADVLERGALLENERFYIAERILDAFMVEKEMEQGQLVLLNGMPRHVGQAGDVDRMLKVVLVVYLECTPSVVYHRIVKNTGGDRAGRTDDAIEAVKKKLELFLARTVPILHHYESRGVRIARVQVDVETTPEDIIERIGQQDENKRNG